MSTQDIVGLIAQIGFPAVMCLMMFKTLEKNNDVISDLGVAVNSFKSYLESMRGGDKY